MSIKQVSSEAFGDFIQQNQIIIIDFWAEWCAPCKNFEPVFEKVAKQFLDVAFLKINIETQADLAEFFQIRSIPHLMIMKEGIVIYSESGAVPESTLVELVEKAIETSVEAIKKEIENEQKS
jgi:thioredoxin 1